MKLIKPLTALSLTALLSLGAYAEETKQTSAPKAQQAKQANTDKASAKHSKASASESNVDAKLAEFSKSIELRFNGINFSQQNNQTQVNFSYVLTNKAKRSIKNIHWTTNYISDKQIILTQDVPLSFEQPIKPKQSIPLTFSVDWENLPPAAKQVLSTQNPQVSALFQAKSLTFSNNQKIVVE